ncbi:MAG: response regulator transcription factor [Candidatus Delongbacteria bacterium]|nr:response regulator transcription factor [Candidatus Delongbacteria bacterium]
MMKILIVDDEPLARKVIQNHLKHLKEDKEIIETESAIEAFELLSKITVDLIFLDIQMPEIDGFELLKLLSRKPEVIIISAYKEYALKGFDFQVTDYLLKPVSLQRFLDAFRKAQTNIYNKKLLENISSTNKNDITSTIEKEYIFIKVNRENIKLDIKDINYIESYGNYVKIITSTEEYLTASTMNETENILSSEKFIRCHRGYIINIDHIKSFVDGLININDKIIPVGRNYLAKVKDFINSCKQ